MVGFCGFCHSVSDDAKDLKLEKWVLEDDTKE